MKFVITIFSRLTKLLGFEEFVSKDLKNIFPETGSVVANALVNWSSYIKFKFKINCLLISGQC